MNPKLISLVEHARNHSPHYNALYHGLPAEGWRLSDLPPVDPAAYWWDSQELWRWPALTAAPEDGHVFKTGGSTGDGKLSVFSRDEWRDFVAAFGAGLARQLRPGDRVANLFFAGDLYTSLLFIHGALSHSPAPVLEFPFTCNVDNDALAAAIRRHRINVLAGVPAQLLRFAHHLEARSQALPEVETVLYGGESLFGEQIALLKQVFPLARIGSVGCASVDAGLIGYADPDCAHGEHRVFDEDSVVEIVDEDSGEPIDEPGRRGLLLVTNLQRRLMPVIRYPSGDLACWREPPGPNRKFALQGRAGNGHRVRVGTLSLFPEELGRALGELHELLGWQLDISREGGRDRLELLLAARAPLDLEKMRQALLAGQPAIAELCETARLSLALTQTTPEAMRTHPRSGKLLRVVDRRDYQPAEATA
ncbi:phenylacetate--CoA ligase family protein [Chromobacterium violaceum]|uniref:phenylacetate--CoA ligase family protein n=1 Tax=Chromobacterium violaceum TaxID=536 RepID=UPI00143D33C1|nr:phenylacetate--CoA ligase [Chromobacterium violaceum]MCD0492476.1 phenylacetate--CoA ligase family protein [Chromobacterium violaceum]QIY79635.1 phenylacetate--CoA ligase [Chromobacterium violaceum]